MKNAKDVPALKAVSQNLMHSNLSVTDGVYGILSDVDVKNRIIVLGSKIDSINKMSAEALIEILKDTINRLDALVPEKDK